MTFLFWGKKPLLEALVIRDIMQAGAREKVIKSRSVMRDGTRIVEQYKVRGVTAETIRARLKTQGVKYRWQNLLADYRVMKVTAGARSHSGQQRSAAWYRDFIEPYRVRTGATLEAALDWWDDMRRREEELEDLDEEEEELLNQYEKSFGYQ